MGEKCWHNGRLIKVPVFIDHYDDTIQNLYGSKNGDKRKYYELSYEEARTEYYRFRSSENWEKSSKVLRISLWLDNAMFGNLHIFVIDFDKIGGTVETESAFFKAAKELGYAPRELFETLRDTVSWLVKREGCKIRQGFRHTKLHPNLSKG